MTAPAASWSLRANVVGYLARKPKGGTMRMTGSFLHEPPMSPQVRALYDEDLGDSGYVWNGSRLWAHQPDTLDRLFGVDVSSLHAERSGLPPARNPGDRRRLGPR